MVNETEFSFANSVRAMKSMVSIGTFLTCFSPAVPALPGATNTKLTFGDCAHFHASACSLPPEPIISTFISITSLISGRKKFLCLNGF